MCPIDHVFIGIWGFKLKSSCLSGKCFPSEASPQPGGIFMEGTVGPYFSLSLVSQLDVNSFVLPIS